METDTQFHRVLNSLHARITALELSTTHLGVAYRWPAKVGGNHRKEKFFDLNWALLVEEYNDTRPLPHDDSISGPHRITLYDPITEALSYKYVSNEFQYFLEREWAKTLKMRIKRDEKITERKFVPTFKDWHPDGTWSIKRRR